MSRIGKNPVVIPDGVSVELAEKDVSVMGPKGALSLTLVDEVSARREDDKIWIEPRDDSQRARNMWGMQRTLVNNMITGVSSGFRVDLEIVGVGYRAQVQGREAVLSLGFSQEVRYAIPDGIEVQCETNTAIAISGIDRQKVGQVAADLRAFRKPEPYKGKGIRYKGEYVFRKEGKKK
jgi:large subunit ribosomal protein L6